MLSINLLLQCLLKQIFNCLSKISYIKPQRTLNITLLTFHATYETTYATYETIYMQHSKAINETTLMQHI